MKLCALLIQNRAVISLLPVVFLKGASWVLCEVRIESLYKSLLHQIQDKNGFLLFCRLVNRDKL